MSVPAVPFSLLDAVRVVARGGGLDDKLAALSDQARTVSEADAVVVLLHDLDAGALLSLDGETSVPAADDDPELGRAVADRTVVSSRRHPRALSQRCCPGPAPACCHRC